MMRCPNPEAHDRHWHVIRAGGVTYAQGYCEGEAKRCKGCAEPDHTEVDYDDCVRAHQPDTEGQCACPCMDNYEPTDEQLYSRARSVHR